MDELRQGDWFSLKGQVAVVTGAGAGIGEASARALARAGAAVVVSDRTLETALAVAEGLVLEGCRAVAVEADVFKDEHLVNLVDTAVNQFGGLNILVNNVGGGGGGKENVLEETLENIQWTYTEVARLFADFKMDLELGPKSRRYLADAGFEDIRVDSFMVSNLDGDPQDFADMVGAWKDVFIGEMARDRGDTPEFIARFRQGLEDHIHAALHPNGYAGWPLWAASARKPL